MFGLFSLPKLLVTAAIIFAVWQGFKWLNNRQAGVKRSESAVKSKKNTSSSSRASSDFSDSDVEEMIPCPDCGAYVAKGRRHRCG